MYTKILLTIFSSRNNHLVKKYLPSFVCSNEKHYQMCKKSAVVQIGLKRGSSNYMH